MISRHSISGDTQVGCAFDQCPKKTFPAKELLFVCPAGSKCPGARPGSPHYKRFFDGQEKIYPERFLFSPKRFAYRVRCPASDHDAYLKVCPHCGTQQPVSMGDATSIAVIGSSSSGKTCYITSLIHQIDQVLARRAMLGMSLEWRDDAGREYFRTQRKIMFNELKLPRFTQKEAPLKSIDITIRFPIRGAWRRFRQGRQAVVSLVFPDPAGELFRALSDAYYLSFLAQAPQVMLMLDPLASNQFAQKRRQSGAGEFDPDGLDDPGAALNAFVNAIRDETGQRTGKIPKDLAVVLTKCDESGLFDPDAPGYGLAQQGRTYDRRLARQLSQMVQGFLEDELGLGQVVSLALENFQHVAFFSASALGRPPVFSRDAKGQVTARLEAPPNPRRVEEPFLWILNRRGLI